MLKNFVDAIFHFIHFWLTTRLTENKVCPSSMFCYGFFAVRNKTGNFLLKNVGLRDHHITQKAQLKCASSIFETNCNLCSSQVFFKDGLFLGKHLILESEYEPNWRQRQVDKLIKMCYSII